jgi:hypothetical protein
MERLLILRLESSGCPAEASFNGVPLLRVDADRRLAWLAVHEYTLAGGNEVGLVIRPGPAVLPPGAAPAAPTPQLSDGKDWVSLRLLLPRIGASASPASARTLGQLDWAAAPDEVWEAPLHLAGQVQLPAGFPRWRWVDAPPVVDTPALRHDAAAWLRDIAIGLARGNPDPLLQATRLRLEDLAQAYQQPLADLVSRLRQQVLDQHAAAPLQPLLPSADTLALRPVAGGRLLECLGADGLPLLRSPTAQGGWMYWPLRLAVIDGRCYGLR